MRKLDVVTPDSTLETTSFFTQQRSTDCLLGSDKSPVIAKTGCTGRGQVHTGAHTGFVFVLFCQCCEGKGGCLSGKMMISSENANK